MTADVHELLQLGVDLRRTAARTSGEVAAVVERGALNVKNDWRANATASSGRHAPHYPRAISYDPHPIPGGAWAEIGPDKARRQGALGNLLEYGSSNNPPHNDGGRALLAEEPRFHAAMQALAERAVQT